MVDYLLAPVVVWRSIHFVCHMPPGTKHIRILVVKVLHFCRLKNGLYNTWQCQVDTYKQVLFYFSVENFTTQNWQNNEFLKENEMRFVLQFFSYWTRTINFISHVLWFTQIFVNGFFIVTILIWNLKISGSRLLNELYSYFTLRIFIKPFYINNKRHKWHSLWSFCVIL